MDNNAPALSALISPRSPDEFFDTYWPDKSTFFLVHGDPTRLPECLRAPETQNIEEMAAINEGGAWVSTGAKTGHMLKVDRRAAESAYKMGLTVYLDNITAVPNAKQFCRQLEWELGLPPDSVRATGWASPTSSGAACHYDTDDVISVQLSGNKRFELAPVEGLENPTGRQYSPGSRLADDIYPQMRNGFPSWDDIDFNAVEMAPGSVLFFRRGTWHRTFASSDSLSVTFVLEAPSAADCILRQLRDVLHQDPRWRKPLHGAWGNAALNEAAFDEARALLAQLPDLASQIAPRDIALTYMPEEQRLASIDGNSRFQRIPNATIVAGADTGSQVEVGIVWRNDDGSVQERATATIPRAGFGALTWISTQDTPFSVDSLAARFPDIPIAGLRQMLEFSAKGGFVKMLWYPEVRDLTS